jgi:hypothetical protein
MSPRLMPEIQEVKINADLLAALDALKPKQKGALGFDWTPELDAALLRYWPIKDQKEVCAVLGCSPNTARARYRELTKT